MKKLIYFITFALFLASASAETTFPNTFIVTSYNYTFNVTTEENTRIFDCNQNLSTSYTFNLKRNVSECSDVAKGLNENFEKIISTCVPPKDLENYFKLYTQCNVENELCKKDSTDKDKTISEMRPYKPNYENANAEIIRITGNVIPALSYNSSILHTNLTECQETVIHESNGKFFWGIIGALIVGVAWALDKKNKTYTPGRSKGPSGLNPR